MIVLLAQRARDVAPRQRDHLGQPNFARRPPRIRVVQAFPPNQAVEQQRIHALRSRERHRQIAPRRRVRGPHKLGGRFPPAGLNRPQASRRGGRRAAGFPGLAEQPRDLPQRPGIPLVIGNPLKQVRVGPVVVAHPPQLLRREPVRRVERERLGPRAGALRQPTLRLERFVDRRPRRAEIVGRPQRVPVARLQVDRPLPKLLRIRLVAGLAIGDSAPEQQPLPLHDRPVIRPDVRGVAEAARRLAPIAPQQRVAGMPRRRGRREARGRRQPEQIRIQLLSALTPRLEQFRRPPARVGGQLMPRIVSNRRLVARQRPAEFLQLLVDRRHVVFRRRPLRFAGGVAQHDDELHPRAVPLLVPIADDPLGQRLDLQPAAQQLLKRRQGFIAMRELLDQPAPGRLGDRRSARGFIALARIIGRPLGRSVFQSRAQRRDPRQRRGNVRVALPRRSLDRFLIAPNRSLRVSLVVEQRGGEPVGAAAFDLRQRRVRDRPVRRVPGLFEPPQAVQRPRALQLGPGPRGAAQLEIAIERRQGRPRLIQRQARARRQQRQTLPRLGRQARRVDPPRQLVRLGRPPQLQQQARLIQLRDQTIAVRQHARLSVALADRPLARRQRGFPESVPLQRVGLREQQIGGIPPCPRRRLRGGGRSRLRLRLNWLRRLRRGRLNRRRLAAAGRRRPQRGDQRAGREQQTPGDEPWKCDGMQPAQRDAPHPQDSAFCAGAVLASNLASGRFGAAGERARDP